MYIARVSAINGRKLYDTQCFDTREGAARAAFKARPKAKSCSTARAVWVESLREWKSYGMDIQWHDKPLDRF